MTQLKISQKKIQEEGSEKAKPSPHFEIMARSVASSRVNSLRSRYAPYDPATYYPRSVFFVGRGVFGLGGRPALAFVK